MKTFLLRLVGLLLALALLALLLSGCAHGDELASALSQPLDSTVRQQVAGQVGARKIKFNGPVTLQIGNGNTGAATDASKAKAPVAAAPYAVASETRPAAGPSWKACAWLAGLALLVGAVGGFWLARRLPAWLPL
ncbi:MAG: hypothetical protein ACRYFX_19590 [Janthinobacterium lividum]